MYTNILNTNRSGTFTPKRSYTQNDYSPSKSNFNKPKSLPQKLLQENESLNSGKAKINLVIDGQTFTSSPVSKPKKSFKSVMETVSKIPLELSNIKLQDGEKIKASYSHIENNVSDSSDMDYVIVVNETNENLRNTNRPLLKSQQRIFDRYNSLPSREPGTLVNLTM